MTICTIHMTSHMRVFTARNVVSNALAVVHAVAEAAAAMMRYMDG